MRNLLLVLTAAAIAAAQGFDVASVKPARSGPIKIEADPGRLTVRFQSLEVLIKVAYGLRDYQFSGPGWLHTERYDIVATTAAPQTRAAQLAMLRRLLVERFRLAVHQESRTIPVYALVVGKGGPKLKPMDASLPAPFELYSNFSMAPTPGGATELRGFGSMGQLSDFLTRVAERPVLDRTGIAGNFDIRLLCAIDGFPGFETSPSVFDAVQTQLGLKLEARTSPVEVTVIDHVERPTAN
jgi:uncharacterized protein (TIGR03435 family)